MTPRKLINKKAYDELVLLKKFCDTQDWSKYYFECGIDLDANNNERFFVVVKTSTNSKSIYGKNYSDITKNLILFFDDHKNG